MRRWLLLLLLVAMPFQMVWGSVAQYCAHETSVESKKHLGHHEHQHEAAADAAATLDIDPGAVTTNDLDCGICHLGASVSLTASVLIAFVEPTASRPPTPLQGFLSHVPEGPERPDRAVLAAAVRFGGGVGIDPPHVTN
jgi:hypothetical protein